MFRKVFIYKSRDKEKFKYNKYKSKPQMNIF